MIGLKLARELDDCAPAIMAVIGVTKFYRDYEDTWEWIEGETSQGIKVNISRPHNWKAGLYDRAILLGLSQGNSDPPGHFMEISAQQIANSLGAEVWIGEVAHKSKQGEYDFKIEKTFQPKPIENR